MEILGFFISARAVARALVAALIAAAVTAGAAGAAGTVFQDVTLPDKLTLCGEPMPLGSPAVREMLDRELTISAWQPEQVFMWVKRSGRAFPVIEKRLAELGMPDDLKYLAVAESSLLPYIESNKAAVGTWQMIEETGVRNGLRKNEFIDDRRSLESSTDGALRYLQKLQQEFGSWAVALAAYNCGEARVRREIDIQKVTDYYRLNLPLETERFVFRIAAIKLVLENPQRYGYVIPKDHIYRPEKVDVITVDLKSPVAIGALSQETGVDFKILKELNPEFTGYVLPAGSYQLRAPKGLGSKVQKAACLLGKEQPKKEARKQGTEQR